MVNGNLSLGVPNIYAEISAHLRDEITTAYSISPKSCKAAAEGLLPAKKEVEHCGGVDPEWSAEDIKKACLANLVKIEQFCHEVLARHVVLAGSNTMRVYIQKQDDKNNALSYPAPRQKLWNRPEGYVVTYIRTSDKYDAPFATKLCTISHEFGHAIVFNSADFEYEREGGALHESFADVFSTMVKHYHSKTRAESPDADWSIGSGYRDNGVLIGSMRSLSDPEHANTREYQPKHL